MVKKFGIKKKSHTNTPLIISVKIGSNSVDSTLRQGGFGTYIRSINCFCCFSSSYKYKWHIMHRDLKPENILLDAD